MVIMQIINFLFFCIHSQVPATFDRLSKKPGGRGRGREWATPGAHPLSWLLSNNRLEKVPFVSVPHTSSNWLLLSNQDKGCTSSVAHSLALPLGPALLNLWTVSKLKEYIFHIFHFMVIRYNSTVKMQLDTLIMLCTGFAWHVAECYVYMYILCTVLGLLYICASLFFFF